MSGLEANIYPITNLNELSSEYRMFRIKGLRPDQEEYHSNRDLIAKRMSYELKTPATTIERDSVPFLIIKSDASAPPDKLQLVRNVVYFNDEDSIFHLDYTKRSPENDAIATRFLQFIIQEPLRKNGSLWQPSSGKPFFSKKPKSIHNGVAHYSGYSVRVAFTPEGQLGLSIDVANKFVSAKGLPGNLSHKQFLQFKGRSFIYRYGNLWYEIKLAGFSDLDVTQYEVPYKNDFLPLIEVVRRTTVGAFPPELSDLSPDASVITYITNQDDTRGAPAPLCHLVYETGDKIAGRLQSHTILAPHERFNNIKWFRERYLDKVRFGDTQLRLTRYPVKIPDKILVVVK